MEGEHSDQTIDYLLYQADGDEDLCNWILQAHADGVDLTELAAHIENGGTFSSFFDEGQTQSEDAVGNI